MSSIRSRLLVPLVVGLAVLLLLGSFGLYLAVSRTLHDGFDAALVEKARALGSRLSLEIDPEVRGEATRLGAAVVDGMTRGEDVTAPRRALLELARGGFRVTFAADEAATGQVEAYEILTETGQRVAGRDGFGDSGRFESADADPTLHDGTLPDGRGVRVARVRIDDVPFRDADWQPVWSMIRGEADLPELSAVVTVAESRDALEGVLTRLRLALAGLGLAFLVGAAILVIVVLRRGLSPLVAIEHRLKSLDAGSLGRRVELEDPPSELQTVVDALNEALAGLDEAFARERRTTANIAHELRTPIAELLSLMEVATEFPDDEELRTQSLEHGRQIALQMTRIVTTLLRVARLESGQEELHPEVVELRPLVESTWSLLQTSASERRQTLDVAVPDSLAIDVDPEAVGLVLTNLLENAVRHAPEGSAIRIRAEARDAAVLLTIANPAPELGSDDVAHVAEPFWRREGSSATAQQGGLGLPLAAQLARAAGLGLAFALAERRFQARIRAPRAMQSQGRDTAPRP